MQSRRDALKIMLATAATAGAATAGTSAAGVPATPTAATDDRPGPTPWEFIQPLKVNDLLGGTWRLATLGPIAAGAVVIELHNIEGQRARVHACARHGEALGVASTPRLDLMLMNHGDGRTASDEVLGRVVLGLAALIEQNEDVAFVAHPQLRDLLTHEQRIQSYQGTPALS